MTQPLVKLRALTRDNLVVITPWFENPDTRRFLGGPQWAAAMLAPDDRCVGTTFRGARQTGCYRYLALAGGTPVGYIDCGTFDRCTVYGGEGPDGPIITDSTDDQRADAPAGARLRGAVRGGPGAREHRVSSLPRGCRLSAPLRAGRPRRNALLRGRVIAERRSGLIWASACQMPPPGFGGWTGRSAEGRQGWRVARREVRLISGVGYRRQVRRESRRDAISESADVLSCGWLRRARLRWLLLCFPIGRPSLILWRSTFAGLEM